MLALTHRRLWLARVCLSLLLAPACRGQIGASSAGPFGPSSADSGSNDASVSESPGGDSGAETPAAPRVDRARIFPRADHALRLVGGIIQGSNAGETLDFVTLGTIRERPAEGAWVELTLDAPVSYRYVKYAAPDGSYGNLAELELYDGDALVRGRKFGTQGGRDGNDFTKALDGDLSSFFDSTLPNGQYVGLDLGDASNTVAAPSLTPPPGMYQTAPRVTLATETSASTLRYTLDGTHPSCEAGTAYQEPVTLPSERTTVKVIACKTGWFPSPIVSGTYAPVTDGTPVRGQTSYHIGNSLTDTLNNWLEPIADSTGLDHTYLRTTVPGAPTDWIWEHNGPDYEPVFASHVIDHFSFQPFSGHGRSISNETEFGGKFYALARQHSPNVRLWVYAQWPFWGDGEAWSADSTDNYSLGVSTTFDLVAPPPAATTFATACDNHMVFHESLLSNLRNVYPGRTISLMPSALGLKNLEAAIEAGRIPGFQSIHDLYEDSVHLYASGQYFVSVMFFSAIYCTSPVNRVTSSVPGEHGLTPAQAVLFQQIAWDTIRTYPQAGCSAD